ncbi:unnamed protein product [Closterium sp. NIES-64]|nr:unnamed protein product [Closterium sp. NIES-64]CAI5989357.1 unnamed protein product [Closterium sp. NIES-64]
MHRRNVQDENMDKVDDMNLRENGKVMTVIGTEARSHDDETSKVGKAMADLVEWIEKKVEAISALADAIRTEWASGEAGYEAGRKRARKADGSSSEPPSMMTQQHLAALSAHAEAIRVKDEIKLGTEEGRGQEPVAAAEGGAEEVGRAGQVAETRIATSNCVGGDGDAEEDPMQEEVGDNHHLTEVRGVLI